MDGQQLEQVLRQLGLGRNAAGFADSWARQGFAPNEMLDWLAVGVQVDEAHIAAALAAAEWTPALASRSVAPGEPITFLEIVRQHPNAASYARELRSMVG
jgi:hypothetical protein